MGKDDLRQRYKVVDDKLKFINGLKFQMAEKQEVNVKMVNAGRYNVVSECWVK